MTDNSEFFKETVDRILADTIDPAAIEAAEQGALPAAAFDALGEMGIFMMLAEEAHGGVGATMHEALAVMRAAGYAAAPGPILENMIGQFLATSAQLALSGDNLAIVFDEGARAGSTPSSVSGATFHAVPWAATADHIILAQPDGEGTRVIVTTAKDWNVTTANGTAGEQLCTITSGEIDAQTATVSSLDFGHAQRMASMLNAGRSVGAIDWILERTVEYSGEREQFGRPLGKFQAVQQMLAEMAGHKLASASLAEAAAQSMCAALVNAARARLGLASDAAISFSHQVHGAMGFSREYPLNYRTRRLMAWRDQYGDVLKARRELAQQFIGESREGFWPALSDAR